MEYEFLFFLVPATSAEIIRQVSLSYTFCMCAQDAVSSKIPHQNAERAFWSLSKVPVSLTSSFGRFRNGLSVVVDHIFYGVTNRVTTGYCLC